MALSFVSINIEWDRHLDRVVPFLTKERPDVACVQELFERDIPLFEEALGAKCFFTPVMQMPTEHGLLTQGNAIFSRTPLTETEVLPYSGSVGASYVHSEDPETWDKDYELRALSGGIVEKDGAPYRIFTTHFNWTVGGVSTPAQLAAAERMLAHLKVREPFILAGDFNAPRGRDTFSLIASRYKDNIPESYEYSLDPVYHTKAGHPLPYMVDGLFTTTEYEARDVRLEFGLSDHAAIVATIEKAP